MREPKQDLESNLTTRGNLDAVVKRRPIKRRRLLGYVVAVVLAIIGYACGILVSGSMVGGIIAALVFFILGILASEFWPTTVVHEKEEHHHNLGQP